MQGAAMCEAAGACARYRRQGPIPAAAAAVGHARTAAPPAAPHTCCKRQHQEQAGAQRRGPWRPADGGPGSVGHGSGARCLRMNYSTA